MQSHNSNLPSTQPGQQDATSQLNARIEFTSLQKPISFSKDGVISVNKKPTEAQSRTDATKLEDFESQGGNAGAEEIKSNLFSTSAPILFKPLGQSLVQDSSKIFGQPSKTSSPFFSLLQSNNTEQAYSASESVSQAQPQFTGLSLMKSQTTLEKNKTSEQEPSGSLFMFPKVLGTNQMAKPSSGGEFISGQNYCYQSLDLMAPMLASDQDLSLEFFESSKAKVFVDGVDAEQRTAMLFLTSKNNISILLDQQVFCENVISVSVQQELGMGEILDFVLVSFNVLCVLSTGGKLTTFDCQPVFVEPGQSEVRFLHKSELKITDSLRIDVAEEKKSGEFKLLVSSKEKIQTITLAHFEEREEQQSFEFHESGGIVDLNVKNDKVVACLQTKLKGIQVVMFDLNSGATLFKALYADCESVQNMVYIPSEDTDSHGHIVLTVLKKSYVKALHLVQIYQRQDPKKKRLDRLDQIDVLTFSDDTPRFVDFAEFYGNYYVFMLNYTKKPDQKLRILTVKISPKSLDESLNESCEDQYAFKFITEATVQSLQKPSYLSVLMKNNTYFLYVGLGNQTIVVRKDLMQVSGVDTIQQLTQSKKLYKPLAKSGLSEVEDVLKKIDDEVSKETSELNQQLEVNVKQAMDELDAPLGSQEDIEQMPETKKKKDKLKKANSNIPPQQGTPPKNQTNIPKQPPPQKSKNMPSSRKAQQDLIIENYAELNKKYTDLTMKLNSLQQHVSAQKDLQVQVESNINKAIMSVLPALVQQQVKDTIQPFINSQEQLLNQQVRQMLPKLEQKLNENAGEPQREKIREIIQSEFRDCLKNTIVPELEKVIFSVLKQMKEPLLGFNKILKQNLDGEEQRSEAIVQSVQQKLSQVQQLRFNPYQQQMQPVYHWQSQQNSQHMQMPQFEQQQNYMQYNPNNFVPQMQQQPVFMQPNTYNNQNIGYNMNRSMRTPQSRPFNDVQYSQHQQFYDAQDVYAKNDVSEFKPMGQQSLILNQSQVPLNMSQQINKTQPLIQKQSSLIGQNKFQQQSLPEEQIWPVQNPFFQNDQQ